MSAEQYPIRSVNSIFGVGFWSDPPMARRNINNERALGEPDWIHKKLIRHFPP